MANTNGNHAPQSVPAFRLLEKHPPAPAATSPPVDASDEIEIPLSLRKKWMALLVEAVRRAGTINVNFADVTVSAHDVRAHQVHGYIRITDEVMRE